MWTEEQSLTAKQTEVENKKIPLMRGCTGVSGMIKMSMLLKMGFKPAG
jgi:hypothetical protein